MPTKDKLEEEEEEEKGNKEEQRSVILIMMSMLSSCWKYMKCCYEPDSTLGPLQILLFSICPTLKSHSNAYYTHF